jgi:hypothetical protein
MRKALVMQMDAIGEIGGTLRIIIYIFMNMRVMNGFLDFVFDDLFEEHHIVSVRVMFRVECAVALFDIAHLKTLPGKQYHFPAAPPSLQR